MNSKVQSGSSCRLTLAICASVGLFVDSGCAGGVEPSAPVAPAAVYVSRPAPRPAVTAALPTEAYFAEATAIDLFELRSADLAVQRSTRAARWFAQQTEVRHHALSAQLSFAGRYLNLLPSRSLPPEYQQMLDQLNSATDFDRLYLAQQRQICARAMQLHVSYARSGASPTLRPVAQFGVSVVNSDLQLLRS